MKADTGLSAARQAVNQAGSLCVASDCLVLLLLDAADDDLQAVVSVLRQNFPQNIVVHGGIRVVHGKEMSVFYFVLPFSCNLYFISVITDLVPGRADIKLIEHGRDGRPPVNHYDILGLLLHKAVDANINAVCFPRQAVLEIHTAEIGGFLHFREPLYLQRIPLNLFLRQIHYGFLSIEKYHIVKIADQVPVVLPHLLSLLPYPLPQQWAVLVQLFQFAPDDPLHLVEVFHLVLKILSFHTHAPFSIFCFVWNDTEIS